MGLFHIVFSILSSPVFPSYLNWRISCSLPASSVLIDLMTIRADGAQSSFFLTDVPLEERTTVDIEEDHRAELKTEEEFEEDEPFLMQLFMLLNASAIYELQRQFSAFQDGLCRYEFIKIMKSFIHDFSSTRSTQASRSEKQLIFNLCALFRQMDTNDDQLIDWDDFMSIMTDASSLTSSSSSHNHEHVDDDGGARTYHGPEYHHVPLARESHPEFGNAAIDQLCYFPSLHSVGICESKATSLKVYSVSHNYRLTKTLSPPVMAAGSSAGPASIQSAEVCPALGQIVLSSSDSKLLFYDDNTNRLLRSVHTPSVQSNLRAYGDDDDGGRGRQLLFSTGASCSACGRSSSSRASSDGIIYVWEVDPQGVRQKAQFIHSSSSLHDSEVILDMQLLERLDGLAVGKMDSTIDLWDISSERHRQTFLGHRHGVRALTYAPQNRMLISASFDFEALVWTPQVPTAVGKLSGHSSSLSHVRMLSDFDDPHVCITSDVEGSFRVWDLRMMGCVSSFGVIRGSRSLRKSSHVHHQTLTSTSTSSSSSVVHTFVPFKDRVGHPTILAAGKALYEFQSDTPRTFSGSEQRSTMESCADYTTIVSDDRTIVNNEEEDPVMYISYDGPSHRFLTSSRTSLRWWSGHSGELLDTQSFGHILNQDDDEDMTAVSLDGRWLLIGTDRGRVYLKKLRASNPQQQASFLELNTTADLVSSSRRDIEISHLMYSQTHEVLIVGFRDHHHHESHVVGVYDISKSHEQNPSSKAQPHHMIQERLLRHMTMSKVQHMTCLVVSDTRGLLASATESQVVLWNVESGRVEGRFEVESKKKNTREEKTLALGILSLKLLDPLPVLLASDTAGRLWFWPLEETQLLQQPTRVTLLHSSSSSIIVQHLAFYYDEQRSFLFTGNDSGQLSIWYLDTILNLHDLDHHHHHHPSSRCEQRMRFPQNNLDQESVIHKILDDQQRDHLSWQGHRDGITSLKLIGGKQVLLLSSSVFESRQVKIWNVRGEVLGGFGTDEGVAGGLWHETLSDSTERQAHLAHEHECVDQILEKLRLEEEEEKDQAKMRNLKKKRHSPKNNTPSSYVSMHQSLLDATSMKKKVETHDPTTCLDTPHSFNNHTTSRYTTTLELPGSSRSKSRSRSTSSGTGPRTPRRSQKKIPVTVATVWTGSSPR